jgi:hypothetical protein
VREASDEERAFHAAQKGDSVNGNEGQPDGNREPRQSAPPRDPSPPRESGGEQREPQREPQREARSGEGSQAPLDLPPPPEAKPFVVWSSAPTSETPGRRDE